MSGPVDAALAAELEMRARSVLAGDADEMDVREREALGRLAQTATALVETGVMKLPVKSPIRFRKGEVCLQYLHPERFLPLLCVMMYGALGTSLAATKWADGDLSPFTFVSPLLMAIGVVGLVCEWCVTTVTLSRADRAERRCAIAELTGLVSKAISSHEHAEKTARECLDKAGALGPETVLPRIFEQNSAGAGSVDARTPGDFVGAQVSGMVIRRRRRAPRLTTEG